MSEKAVGRVEVDPAFLKYVEQLPTMDTFFPYYFKGGGVIESLESAACIVCGKEVPLDKIKGSFSEESAEGTVTIKGYSLCFDCNTITPFELRVNQDGTQLARTSGGWLKGRWSRRVPSPLHSLKEAGQWLRNRWQQWLPPLIAVMLLGGWFYCGR